MRIYSKKRKPIPTKVILKVSLENALTFLYLLKSTGPMKELWNA